MAQSSGADSSGGGQRGPEFDNTIYHVVDAEDCEVQMAAQAAEVQKTQGNTTGDDNNRETSCESQTGSSGKSCYCRLLQGLCVTDL